MAEIIPPKKEKRIGELLIELNLITQEQLDEALKLVADKKIKIGEALYSLGLIQKNDLYWVLGRQLDMTYMELSVDMADDDLLKKFSLQDLIKLNCMPLYEDGQEIHFAIADPTDVEKMSEIQNLCLSQSIKFHLAAPDKIASILNEIGIKKTVYPKDKILDEECPTHKEQCSQVNYEHDFNRALCHLLGMGDHEKILITDNNVDCRLYSIQDKKSQYIERYQTGTLEYIKSFLKKNSIFQNFENGYAIINIKTSKLVEEIFHKCHFISSLRGEYILVERIPKFYINDFKRIYPDGDSLIADIAKVLSDSEKLIIGGEDELLFKRALYCVLFRQLTDTPYIDTIFVEENIKDFFPMITQILQCNKNIFAIETLCNMNPTLLLYEVDIIYDIDRKFSILAEIFARFERLIIFYRSKSADDLRKNISINNTIDNYRYKMFFINNFKLVEIAITGGDK